jgi:hypothetical protein
MNKVPLIGGMKQQDQQQMNHYESSFGDVSSIMITPD